MILESEINIDDTLYPITINYNHFKENGEVIININSIIFGDGYTELIPNSVQLENIKDDCQIHYENHKFMEIESLMDKTWYGIDNCKEEL